MGAFVNETSLLFPGTAVCETVIVQNGPWAGWTRTWGLSDVAVKVWVGLLLPLPSSGSWYPVWEGTLRLLRGASDAAINWRPSRTSTKGWRLECFEPGRDPAPCRSERE